ncbi:hypothetical protein [Mycolicibacterium monacense]|uniref:hypothetical protein n=1 Tax=Mycolicibacterium monacense TaxID=85693 RepID=UPI0007EBD108|nr:hypothetical protein [Mycolicibacterium monacense]OBF52528.1 hypothetical protein A5778_15520 [Mycolicibacterium monacense]
MTDLLADCEAMAPLLAAFARGTKRSRLRQLVVVCPQGHTLAEIFPTSHGPHVVWKQMHTWERIDGETVMTRSIKWHGAPLQRVFDAELGVAEAVAGDISSACRCTEQAVIRGQDLIAWMDSGRKRVVHTAV